MAFFNTFYHGKFYHFKTKVLLQETVSKAALRYNKDTPESGQNAGGDKQRQDPG